MRLKKTVLYSSTRQWNPGDEFILFGVRNLLTSILGDHNPVIYNRNPDIRPDADLIGLQLCYEDRRSQLEGAGIYLRHGFNDNSVKYDTDASFIDLTVVAGTPEWSTRRCNNFYYHILKNSLPLLILGVGHTGTVSSYLEDIISQVPLFTVRDRKLLDDPIAKKYNAVYLPCPALFTSPLGTEKVIHQPKKIGITFGVSLNKTVPCNGIDEDVYQSVHKIYLSLIKKYQDQFQFCVICHYIDELAEAHRIFTPLGIPVLYSYDAKDYIDIYREMDMIVSTRVHACGIAASLGIPSICFLHDARGTTVEGFLAEAVSPFLTFENFDQDVFQPFIQRVPERNAQLVAHKKKTFEDYRHLISQCYPIKRPNYSAHLELELPNRFQFNEILYDVIQFMMLKSGPTEESLKQRKKMLRLVRYFTKRFIKKKNSKLCQWFSFLYHFTK